MYISFRTCRLTIDRFSVVFLCEISYTAFRLRTNVIRLASCQRWHTHGFRPHNLCHDYIPLWPCATYPPCIKSAVATSLRCGSRNLRSGLLSPRACGRDFIHAFPLCLRILRSCVTNTIFTWTCRTIRGYCKLGVLGSSVLRSWSCRRPCPRSIRKLISGVVRSFAVNLVFLSSSVVCMVRDPVCFWLQARLEEIDRCRREGRQRGSSQTRRKEETLTQYSSRAKYMIFRFT
jgi:hypothetical protein